MPNPTYQSLTQDTWTRVAANVVAVSVRIVEQASGLRYWYTYREPGAATPVGAEGAQCVASDKHSILFANSYPIDCWVKAVGADGEVMVSI